MTGSFGSLCNFRDVGGMPVAGGRVVAAGRLFRSDLLARLAPDEHEAFAALGVRTVIDLRYDWEGAADGRVSDVIGARYVNLSIEHRPYDQAALGPEVDVVEYLSARHAEVLEDGVVELRQVLELLADADALPAIVHCTSGKDRTGLVVALALSLLGAARDDVAADFARTGAATPRLRAHWIAAHPGRELVWPGYGTAPAALAHRLLDDLDARYGSVAAYVHERLGVSEATVAALREHLLTPV